MLERKALQYEEASCVSTQEEEGWAKGNKQGHIISWVNSDYLLTSLQKGKTVAEKINEINNLGIAAGVYISPTIQTKLTLPIDFETRAFHQEGNAESFEDGELGKC